MTPRILKKSLLFIIAIILVLGLSISFQSLLAAWTAPAANPPTCATGNAGCDAPLNAGPLIQLKSGALWLNTNGLSPYGLIVENGKVGIGTVAPQDKLDVEGGSIVVNRYSGYSASGLYLSSTIGPTHYNWRITAQDQVGAALEFGPSTAPGSLTWDTPKMVIMQSGNVGIGTTNPNAKLSTYNQTCPSGWNCHISTWDIAAQSAQLYGILKVSGNVYANDYWIAAAGKWASQGVPQGTWCGRQGRWTCMGYTPPSCPSGYSSGLICEDCPASGNYYTCVKN